ncbi:MAG: hypothetical protein GY820_29770 [Gammaproteobacteria bacterium]|nr:hypothetical protein [Gammaproteobacteria bacterium]
MHTECPLVLWIVPSNAILTQTVQALRNRKHPYRQAVEAAGGTVNILDIETALYVNRAQLDGETNIIITTMQAFRVEDTEELRLFDGSFQQPAADLKSARMIKMPIHLTTRADWKELLADAVHCRNGLEQKANLDRQRTGEYIRPVMLIQAQPKRKGQETLSVDMVKNCPSAYVLCSLAASRSVTAVEQILGRCRMEKT